MLDWRISKLQKAILDSLFWLQKEEDFKGFSVADICKLYYGLKSDDIENRHRASVSKSIKMLKEKKLIGQGIFLTELGKTETSELEGISPIVPQEIKEDIPPAENEKKEKEEKPGIPSVFDSYHK